MANVNGRANASHVWEWIDESGQPVYVSWGTIDSSYQTPWERLWADRAKCRGTLGEWLRTLTEAPRCSWRYLPSVPLDRSTCAAVCRMRRRQMRAQGVKLLTAGNYRGGDGLPRATLGYPSLRQAAAAMNIPWATFWRTHRGG